MSREFTIALVGNPNCGKTTLFNDLTGTHQKVGNWPGVTVEQKTGHFQHAQTRFNVIDLPGTYSLHASCEDDSIDQQIAQQFVLEKTADLIINIVDASSLERGLYLTTQLMEAEVPLVVALNMMDVADQNGVHIDPYELSDKLGLPVVALVASRGEGVGTLIDVVDNHLHRNPEANYPVTVAAPVETAAQRVLALMKQEKPNTTRLEATAVLERDSRILQGFSEELQNNLLLEVNALQSQLNSSISDTLITNRYQWINQAIATAVHHEAMHRRSISDYLDAVLLNRFLAFPAFLGVMYLMFMVTINFGGAFIDFFDIAAGAIFVELPRILLTAIHCPEWLTALIADGAGGGIQLVASFVPVIGTLFLFQTFLEDSGYMARAAFILDRLMRSIGLPGKSFVPLVVGFGCNVPSVMASRTLDTQQDRLLTTLMAPFMSCGARLTVYTLFAAAFFTHNGQNVVFGLYIIGIVLAVLTGLLVRRKMLSRDIAPFIMELPNYHVPTLRGLLIHSWHRLRGFMLRAGKAIVAVVIILNFVNSIGTDGSFNNQNTERSLLSSIGKTITPIFEPLGVKEENWPATVGIFSGIFAKEVVVGTLDALYTDMALAGSSTTDETSPSIGGMLGEAFASIPANLAEVNHMWGDPLGLSVGDLADQQAAAQAQEVELTTIGLMQQLFATPIAAFSYILFVLLYMPCVATLGAIYKEAGGTWAFFSATWNTLLAYAVAVMTYQLGTFSEHPEQSLMWTGAMAAILLAGYFLLMEYGKRQARRQNLIPAVNLHG
ncbi:Fe(2+) transporter permease subunit FeoB [Porticoccus litoralis]|uniref:Ferrous iron transport protein B n=1 Tax=Porticoccus litoralis TaxID=434086 RepID=A0AAW8B1I1_9GAMM|nr:Fe(2+) transporter permease subunit FeoB [Porticoccus litoralis]MDP1520410.1 Fe(2+) transporter permease subunit FeoB [Porticoccus litoralis]